jgi:hypothetical protein
MTPWRNGTAGVILALGMTSAPMAAASAAETASPKAQPAPFVPAGFDVPTLAEGPGFKLVPLGPALVKIDYDAYMSSIEHLQKTFTRSSDWPTVTIIDADAMKDMETEAARFQKRQSFAYGVLTPDGRRERGSVYVSPSPIPGYDAVVRLWVTKAEHDAGFDAKLYAWVTDWVRTKWPFARVAYPGRAIDWASWDALVAASPAKAKPAGG